MYILNRQLNACYLFLAAESCKRFVVDSTPDKIIFASSFKPFFLSVIGLKYTLRGFIEDDLCIIE